MNEPKTIWKGRDTGGFTADVEGLGRVEIFQTDTRQGRVVFINGKQFSGGNRDGLDGIRLRMDQDIQRWHYFNQYASLKMGANPCA